MAASAAGQRLGRRQKIFALREWIRATYDLGACQTILDVAGGRGDLSWLLCNVDGVDSVVVDPRPTNHSSLLKVWFARKLLNPPIFESCTS